MWAFHLLLICKDMQLYFAAACSAICKGVLRHFNRSYTVGLIWTHDWLSSGELSPLFHIRSSADRGLVGRDATRVIHRKLAWTRFGSLTTYAKVIIESRRQARQSCWKTTSWCGSSSAGQPGQHQPAGTWSETNANPAPFSAQTPVNDTKCRTHTQG